MGSFYDEFADDFSNKRRKPWKSFIVFVKSIENEKKFQNSINKGIWCDLGAGNGRHLQTITEFTQKYVGTDISFPLLRIARDQNDPKKAHNWVACDINALPFRKNSFQSIVSVAVIHHVFPKRHLRKVLTRISKILCKDGTLILTLWGIYDGKNESVAKRKNFHRRISKMEIVELSTDKKYILGPVSMLEGCQSSGIMPERREHYTQKTRASL